MRPVRTLALAATLVATAAAPAYAGFSASISVSPTTVRPTGEVTVTGTTDCDSVPYTVTLTYTAPDGDPATATATGTTDASGEFTQVVTVPETAVAGEPANVTATVDCAGGTATASPVDLTIEPWEGTLSALPTSGQPGTTVHVSGTLCYGDAIAVFFGDGESFADEVEVTLAEDRTFEGDYVVPDQPGGEYAFFAECPGSEFEPVPFTLANAANGGGNDGEEEGVPTESVGSPGSPPEAGPAVPMPGIVRVTG